MTCRLRRAFLFDLDGMLPVKHCVEVEGYTKLSQVLAKFICGILRSLIGMKHQSLRATAPFECVIEHLLNKCRVSRLVDIKSHHEPGVEVDNDPDGI